MHVLMPPWRDTRMWDCRVLPCYSAGLDALPPKKHLYLSTMLNWLPPTLLGIVKVSETKMWGAVAFTSKFPSRRFIRPQMRVSSAGNITLRPFTSSWKVWEIIFQEVKEWGWENSNKGYSFQKNLQKKKLNLCCPVEDDSIALEMKPLHSCTGWVHMVQAPPSITYMSVPQRYKW